MSWLWENGIFYPNKGYIKKVQYTNEINDTDGDSYYDYEKDKNYEYYFCRPTLKTPARKSYKEALLRVWKPTHQPA